MNSNDTTLHANPNSVSDLSNQIDNLSKMVEDIYKTLKMLREQLNIKDNDKEEYEDSQTCRGYYTSGLHRGSRCSARALQGIDYCGKHKPGGNMGSHLKNKRLSIKEDKKEETV